MNQPINYKDKLIANNTKSMQKLSVNPIIVPRAHDKDVWSHPSYRHSVINYNDMKYDITSEYRPIPEIIKYNKNDERVSTYTNFKLDNLQDLLINAKAYDKIKNKIDNKTNIEQQTTKITQLKDKVDIEPQTTKITQLKDKGDIEPQTTKITQLKDNNNILSEPFTNKNNIEKFSTLEYTENDSNNYNNINNTKINKNNLTLGEINRSFSDYNDPKIDRNTNEILNQKEELDDKEKITNINDLPSQNLLIPKAIPSIYGLDNLTTRDRFKYMENIQPNLYTFSDVAEPINSNLGISYTPQTPPLVLDQVATQNGVFPIFHRVDPQLIRDGGISPDRVKDLPRRTAWTAKYSGFEAGPGSIRLEDIYDPRFNGYGDQYRSYGDVNTGNVNYYYSDVDAYRYPNFTVRSKVDFIDFVDPMGRILPEYNRNVGVEDVKQTVHNQYDADSIYFREDLQERLMRKRNREMWQLRAAPIRKDAHLANSTYRV